MSFFNAANGKTREEKASNAKKVLETLFKHRTLGIPARVRGKAARQVQLGEKEKEVMEQVAAEQQMAATSNRMLRAQGRKNLREYRKRKNKEETKKKKEQAQSQQQTKTQQEHKHEMSEPGSSSSTTRQEHEKESETEREHGKVPSDQEGSISRTSSASLTYPEHDLPPHNRMLRRRSDDDKTRLPNQPLLD